MLTNYLCAHRLLLQNGKILKKSPFMFPTISRNCFENIIVLCQLQCLATLSIKYCVNVKRVFHSLESV